MPIYFVFALSFFAFAAVNAVRLLLSLYALQLGAQAFAIGLLSATFSLFPMLLAVPAGKLADRYGARWPLLLSAAVAAGGVLVPYFFRSLAALYVASALNGLAFAFFTVCLMNLVGVMSSKAEDRTKNYSNFSLMVSAANTLGPSLVGFSIDHFGHAYTCLYLALVSLAPIVLLMARPRILPRGSGHAVKGGGNIRKSLSDPAVLKVLATSSLLMLGIDFYHFYMPIYSHTMGLSASAIGIVLGAFAAASIVVRIILPRIINRYSMETVLSFAFYLGAASFVFFPLFQNAYALALLSFVLGLGLGCGQPIVTMLTFDRSAAGRSGEALGLRLTVNHLTRVIAPVMFGAIASGLGLLPAFWITALMLGGAGLLGAHKESESRAK